MINKTIIISGASSGIGKQLAVLYSAKHYVEVIILLGRDAKRLEEVKNLCLNNNSKLSIYIYCFNIADKISVEQNMKQITQNHKIDIAIANAGVSAGTLGGFENQKQVNTLIDVNIKGVVDFICPVIEQLKQDTRSGNICLISSVAGLLPLSSSPSYSASKAFVRYYGNAIRSDLKKHNIYTTVICPAYIKTPMTDVNKFKMPLLMSVEKASKIIIKAIENNKGLVCFPFVMYLVARLTELLPYKVLDFALSKLPKKSSIE